MTPSTSTVFQKLGSGTPTTAVASFLFAAFLPQGDGVQTIQHDLKYYEDFSGDVFSIEKVIDSETSLSSARVQQQSQNVQMLNSFVNKLVSESIDIEPEIAKFVRKRFWDLI